MNIQKLTTQLVVFTCFLCIPVKNIQAQDYDLNTTTNLYSAPNVPKPGYLADYNDPVFNTKVTRISGDPGTSIPGISGATWPNRSRHGYSTRQAWNADESILWLEEGNIFLNGESYVPISSSGNIPSGNEHRWHPTDPNLMLILRDNSVVSWNYITNQTSNLITFNGYSNTSMGYTGNWSDDGNKIAMYAQRNSDGKQVIFAVDTQNNIKYPDRDVNNVGIDYVSISPLGTYIMVNGNFGNGGDRTTIFDLNGNQVGPYWSEYGQPSHADIAIDQNGDEVAVGIAKGGNNEGALIKRRLSDGQITVVNNMGWPIHTSARCILRPGWVVSWTDPSTNYGPAQEEIIFSKLDGTRVERVCHVRNNFGDYWNQAQPSPSPSGNRVIFATDWNNGTYPIQAYVADFRDLGGSGFTIDAGEDQNICEGSEEDVILTASEAQSYLWSTGETTQNITVLPEQTTTYTVTGTDSEGNEASDSVVVIVTPIPLANAGVDVEICQSESITLTALGGSSYQWSTGQSSQSITVNPEESTTYTVTVSNNDCSATDDVTVTVRPRPSVNAGNDVDIYQNESITLTASGNGTFVWSTGEETESITVSPLETTTYSVTVSEGECSNTDYVTVFVLDQESVSANAGEDVTICQGETTTLFALGGTNFLWNTGASSQSIEVSPAQTTVYTVIVSNSDGSLSDEDQVTVYVNLLPNAFAGEDVTIESGQSTTLTGSGGNTYYWNTGALSQSIHVSPTETTTYTVQTFVNGCSNSDDVVVTVVDQVNANAGEDVEICLGESVTLTASGGEYFLWNTGEETPTVSVSPNETTTYSVEISNGISTQMADVMVGVLDCQAIDNFPQNFDFEYVIYPNPTDGLINIKLTGLENISSIYISDLLGKVISSESFESNDGYVINKQYDFSSLSKGIYLITFKQSGETAITKKLILR